MALVQGLIDVVGNGLADRADSLAHRHLLSVILVGVLAVLLTRN